MRIEVQTVLLLPLADDKKTPPVKHELLILYRTVAGIIAKNSVFPCNFEGLKRPRGCWGHPKWSK